MMYVVIFKAEREHQDSEYIRLAKELKRLAFDEFGCLDFYSISQGDQEVTLSYWPTLDSINAWKEHPLHLKAQQLGKTYWYRSYESQICQVLTPE